GSNLRTASVWADCAKGVNERNFKYGGVGQYPECAVYEKTAASKHLMEAFVQRNVGTCQMPEGSEVCHKQYHYADVAIQRNEYKLGLKGTSDHDVVAAINAMIAVLQDRPSPAPFHIADKKEALRLLSHYVGDVHQPLHVGAVYVDASGNLVDPDHDTFDPVTETTGGNDLLLDRPGSVKKPRNLHHEWDSVKGSVVSMPVPAAVIKRAQQVSKTVGQLDGWSTVWATESVLASKSAYKDLTYEPLDEKAKRYLITLPVGYGVEKGKAQRERVVLAGARLAQILSEIWP
ncbi:MAG: S1/P1 nuclease, partial [Variovorax sp.]